MELKKQLAFQNLEISRLGALNASLKTELKEAQTKNFQLERLAQLRLDKSKDADLERLRLAESLLTVQQRLAETSVELAEKSQKLDNHLLINQEAQSLQESSQMVDTVNRPCPNCSASMKIQEESIQLARKLSDKEEEIIRLNASITQEMHLNGSKSAQVGFKIESLFRKIDSSRKGSSHRGL